MSLENFIPRSYERRIDAGKKPQSLWERISEEALRLIEEDENLGSDFLNKAKFLLEDLKFRQERKEMWNQQTINGNTDVDLEKQEKLWAVGLVKAVKDRIAN